MKRILLGICCLLILGGGAIVPTASAGDWKFWHRHKKTPATANANHKDKPSKHHRERETRDSSGALYSTPKTVGWWHRGPGPAGAGAK
jgi:hypothetical protein